MFVKKWIVALLALVMLLTACGSQPVSGASAPGEPEGDAASSAAVEASPAAEPEPISGLCGTLVLEAGWQPRKMTAGVTLFWEKDKNTAVIFVSKADTETQGIALTEVPALVAQQAADEIEYLISYDGLTVQWGEGETVTVAGQEMLRLHGEVVTERGMTTCRLYAYFLHSNYEYIPFTDFPVGAVLMMKLNDPRGESSLDAGYVEQLEADLDRMMETFCPYG